MLFATKSFYYCFATRLNSFSIRFQSSLGSEIIGSDIFGDQHVKRIIRRSNSRCKANVAEKSSIWYKKNALLWVDRAEL